MLKIYHHIAEYYMIVKSGIQALYARDYYPIVLNFSLDEGITSLLIGDDSYSGDSDGLNVLPQPQCSPFLFHIIFSDWG